MDVIKTHSNLAEVTLDAAAQPEPKPDGFLGRVLKLVPAEAIAAYTALLAITGAASESALRAALPVALVACTAMIVLALRNAGKTRKPPWSQYVFSLVAFWTWAFAIRDPLPPFGGETPTWIPAFGCVLVPAFGALLIEVTNNRHEGED